MIITEKELESLETEERLLEGYYLYSEEKVTASYELKVGRKKKRVGLEFCVVDERELLITVYADKENMKQSEFIVASKLVHEIKEFIENKEENRILVETGALRIKIKGAIDHFERFSEKTNPKRIHHSVQKIEEEMKKEKRKGKSKHYYELIVTGYEAQLLEKELVRKKLAKVKKISENKRKFILKLGKGTEYTYKKTTKNIFYLLEEQGYEVEFKKKKTITEEIKFLLFY